YTIPNVTGLGMLHTEHSFFSSSIKMIYRFCFLRISHVFFQNNDDLETFNLGFMSSRIKQIVLPGSGVNINKFCPHYNTTKKSKTIKFLFFGRLLKEKGVIEYLEAARHFYQHDPKHKFYILGFLDSENKSAISFNDLKTYIDYYNVTYLEPTDDVSSILCDFDCVVFPSYYFEGVPRCLIEAASCGLPIITNNSRGCREVVDEGFNGFLCEPKNINSLISKINQFINLSSKSRLQMGKNSRDKALNYFDEEIVLNSYVNVLKSYEYM
ncbi:glycosyltransferase, partial [Opitutales bacterium]|nr:glycosyltransferase [Opitutales bacterium]